MTDGQALLLVLVLLYLFDCIVWVGARTVLFAAPWCRRWRASFAGPHLGNREGSAAFGNPLPPLGGIYAGHWLPISLSPDGVCSFSQQTLGGAHRCQQTGRVLAYKDIEKVESDGKHLLLNGERFVKCESFDQAIRLAELIGKLRKGSANKREKLIRQFHASRFDKEQAEERLAVVADRVGWVRCYCNLFFLYLYVLLPLAVFRNGLSVHLITGAIVILFMAFLISLLFFLGHRRLHPEARSVRLGHVAKMMLCPPAAVRAHDQLGLEAMAQFHPILLGDLLLREGKEELAGAMVRDLRHPLPHGLDDPQAVAIVEWHTRAKLAACEAFLRSAGTGMEGLLSAPEWDGHATKYCPRCLAQLKTDAEDCPDCPGVSLLSMVEAQEMEVEHAE